MLSQGLVVLPSSLQQVLYFHDFIFPYASSCRLVFYSILSFVFLEFLSYRLLSRSYLTICYKLIFLPTVPFMNGLMTGPTCFASPFLNLEIIFPSIR